MYSSMCFLSAHFAVASSPENCKPFYATRGASLRLPCSRVSGCLTTHIRWFRVSGSTREEIESGKSQAAAT